MGNTDHFCEALYHFRPYNFNFVTKHFHVTNYEQAHDSQFRQIQFIVTSHKGQQNYSVLFSLEVVNNSCSHTIEFSCSESVLNLKQLSSVESQDGDFILLVALFQQIVTGELLGTLPREDLSDFVCRLFHLVLAEYG